jgi:hypothetical protein
VPVGFDVPLINSQIVSESHVSKKQQAWESSYREARDESMKAARELKRRGFDQYRHLVCMARAENRTLVRRLRGL